MEKNRLFTFGCSHTQYKWPSWADILGLSYKEFYNLGNPGSGIFYMLYQFKFANEYYKFDKDDTLIFMLSNETRIDIIKKERWLLSGHVYSNVDVFGKQFLEHYSERHAIESSYIYLSFLKEMLDTIGCKYEIVFAFKSPITESLKDDELLTNMWNNYKNLTNVSIDSLTSYSESVMDNSYPFINSHNQKKYRDGHFTIKTHLGFVKKYLKQYYDEKCDTTVNEWDILIKNLINKEDSLLINSISKIVIENKVGFVNGKIKKYKLM
jgi:hypothetical protein